MKICITGVAGFIGSNLADRLIEDHEVWGIDNLETGRRENVSFEFYEEDITDGLWELGKADIIVHCAASYKDPKAWDTDAMTNIGGALAVCEAALEWDARVIYFQTVLPPISSYAISKIAAEQYLRLSGVPLTVFRLAAVYGPRNLSGAIPTFYRQIVQGKPCAVVEDATRDFVFIDDLVETVLDTEEDGVFDIRTGVETPIRHIPALISEMLDIDPEVNLVPRGADDVQQYEMSGPPTPGTPFVVGLAKAVEWYEANGVDNTYTHLNLGASNAS